MKYFTGKYHKIIDKETNKNKGGQIFIGKNEAEKINFQNKEELLIEYDENTNTLKMKPFNDTCV